MLVCMYVCMYDVCMHVCPPDLRSNTNIYIYKYIHNVGEVQIPTRPFIGGPMKGALHLLITNSYLVPNLMVKLLFTPHQVGYFLIE